MILTPLQKLPNNVGDLGKLIAATGFERFPKVQKIAQSGHTAQYVSTSECEKFFMTKPELIGTNFGNEK